MKAVYKSVICLGVAASGPFLSACESCDFSFGPVQYTVRIQPIDVLAEVTLCTEREGCQTKAAGPDSPEATFAVGHEGYLVCKAPAYDVTVIAEGCAPIDMTGPEVRTDQTAVTIDLELLCGAP